MKWKYSPYMKMFEYFCNLIKYKPFLKHRLFMYQRQVSFGEAISRAMKKYCCFKGRASRSEFWWFILFLYIVQFAASLLSCGIYGSSISALAVDPTALNDPDVMSNLISLYVLPSVISLVFFLPAFGLLFRRLHDAGHSGFCWLLGLIPVVGGIILLVFTLQDSQMFTNKYGAVPNVVEDNYPPEYQG